VQLKKKKKKTKRQTNKTNKPKQKDKQNQMNSNEIRWPNGNFTKHTKSRGILEESRGSNGT